MKLSKIEKNFFHLFNHWVVNKDPYWGPSRYYRTFSPYGEMLAVDPAIGVVYTYSGSANLNPLDQRLVWRLPRRKRQIKAVIKAARWQVGMDR